MMRTNFTQVEPSGGWGVYLSRVFSEEARLNASLEGSSGNFMRDFPAKSYFDIAAKHLKFVNEGMVEVFCRALQLNDEEAKSEQKLKELRDTIVVTLTPYLWPRTS
jgi:hypothetical protein